MPLDKAEAVLDAAKASSRSHNSMDVGPLSELAGSRGSSGLRHAEQPRMEPRRARMRGVRAPHRRTAHTGAPVATVGVGESGRQPRRA
ncbi:MAG TPA: hypothetical protein VIV12_27830, partial [Streptosporangiaceae bacterium]